jgi:hypothetical protein
VEEQLAERRRRFFAYAVRARAKPAFDVEERDWKPGIAAQLTAAIEAAAAKGDWLSALRAAFNAGTPFGLTSPAHKRWLLGWAEANAESARRALAVFGEGPATAEERFAAFAQAAAEAPAADGGPDAAALLALGSLFNFAGDPEALPMMRRAHFQRLEELLGEQPGAAETTADEYSAHLRFAQAMRRELVDAGVAVRDMMDVQSLIHIGSAESAMWAERSEQGMRIGQPAPGDGRQAAQRSGRPYLSVCAIYRNEAPYLREWIEFHRIAGVERFFLYDNHSTDAHRDALAPYLEEGLVVLDKWDVFPEDSDQRETYDHCLATHRDDSRWIAFIDIDEFLFSPTGRPLPELLVDYEGWPAVCANWAMFGTSGHRTKPEGLVIESYTERVDAPANMFVKSVVDPTRAERCRTAHNFDYRSLMAVDENHYPVHGAQTKSVSFARLRVNHYVTKSEEEAEAKLGAPPHFLRKWRGARLEDEFPRRPDDAIAPYVVQVREALARTAQHSPDPYLSPS